MAITESPLAPVNQQGLDVSANVEVSFNLNAQRVTGPDKVLENHVDDVFMKDLYVAKRIDVKLQAFQLDAAFVGNILETDGGEIREVGKGADGRELSNLEIDLDFVAGKFVRESVERIEFHFRAWSGFDIETLLINGRDRAFLARHGLLLKRES